MNREILEKPFAAQQIKQREGNFGTIPQTGMTELACRLIDLLGSLIDKIGLGGIKQSSTVCNVHYFRCPNILSAPLRLT